MENPNGNKMRKTTSIPKLIEKIWDDLPEQFGSYTLCLLVQKEMRKEQNYAMQGTILRRLRELREAGKCMYKVIKPSESLYKKVE